MAAVRVPGGAKLAEGESRVVEARFLGRQREVFLLRHQSALRAFLNECPHWAVELDLGDGHFYDSELDRIYCKNHGALFFADTGTCETGPCLGRSLQPFDVTVEGDDALIQVVPEELGSP